MKLEEIKIKYAKEKGFDTWTRFINDQPNYMVEQIMDEISALHAIETLESFIKKIVLKDKGDEIYLIPVITKKEFLKNM